VKVVVVILAGEFIAGGLAGEFDGDEPAFLDQGLDVPVNGGDAESADVALRDGEDFVGGHGPPGGFECFANRSPLTCFPDHGAET
jgi:hypothetical protein